MTWHRVECGLEFAWREGSGTDSKLGWSPSVKDRSPAQDWWLASIGLVAHKPSGIL